jgi:hypothetical protein
MFLLPDISDLLIPRPDVPGGTLSGRRNYRSIALD